MSTLNKEVQQNPAETPLIHVDNSTPGPAHEIPPDSAHANHPGEPHSEEEPSRPTTGDSDAESNKAARKTSSSDPLVSKIHTNLSWPIPAGLPLKAPNDECLLVFRRAIGINSDAVLALKNVNTLEEGRRRATGIYGQVVRQKRHKRTKHRLLNTILTVCHVVQIVVAAVLTALGPNAKQYEIAITILGAVNTIVAGVLALLKGSGYLEQLANQQVQFQKLQDWIEETESLLCAGVIGSSRKEVGVFVEVAFRKYNACRGSYDPNSTSNIDGMRNGMRNMKDHDGK